MRYHLRRLDAGDPGSAGRIQKLLSGMPVSPDDSVKYEPSDVRTASRTAPKIYGLRGENVRPDYRRLAPDEIRVARLSGMRLRGGRVRELWALLCPGVHLLPLARNIQMAHRTALHCRP